jgi:hypothetical protein
MRVPFQKKNKQGQSVILSAALLLSQALAEGCRSLVAHPDDGRASICT